MSEDDEDDGDDLVIGSFEEWVDYVFDHPVTEPAWHWDLDAEQWDEEAHPAEVVAYMTALFEKSTQTLARFSNGQLGQGFNFLASPACSSHMFALLDTAVPWEDRRRCIRSMTHLYGQCFRSRCSVYLFKPNGDALDEVCYLWFDMIPIYGRPDDPTRAELDAEFLGVLKEILWIPHDACHNGAARGLAEWGRYYRTQAQAILNEFNEFRARPNVR